MYQLTKEGREYLEKGLPEKRLLLKLKTPKSMKDLKGEEIAVGWARKNKWIIIKQGKVELTEMGKEVIGKKIQIEEALEELNSTGNTNTELLKVLLSRKLAEETKEKKEFEDKEITQLTPDIIISEIWKKIPFRKYDVKAPAPVIYPGKKQAYRAFLDQVKQELIALGFKEMTGPIIESSFFNCDALYMPQDHPARGIHDIYFLNGKADLGKYSKQIKAVKEMHENGGFGSRGWGVPFSAEETKKLVLRSQVTAVSARTLMSEDLEIPGKYFVLGRIYRPDIIDATHLPEFNQIDGIMLGEDVNFRQLLWFLESLCKRLTGAEMVRFLPGYFPFTEPSVEGFVFLPKLKKWTEIIGAGIFRPELTKPLGINVPVLAWCFGLDRTFMIRNNINDIRQLFSYDLNWLREAKI